MADPRYGRGSERRAAGGHRGRQALWLCRSERTCSTKRCCASADPAVIARVNAALARERSSTRGDGHSMQRAGQGLLWPTTRPISSSATLSVRELSHRTSCSAISTVRPWSARRAAAVLHAEEGRVRRILATVREPRRSQRQPLNAAQATGRWELLCPGIDACLSKGVASERAEQSIVSKRTLC